MINKLKDLGTKVQTGIDLAASQSNKFISNARGVENTVDETFEVERKRFNSYLSTMEQMYESIKKHSSGIKHMTEGLYTYSQGVAFFSGEERKIPHTDEFTHNCEKFKTAAETYRAAVGQMEVNLKQKIELLNLLKREVNERDRLLLEYDKVRHELNVEQKKPAPNPTAVSLIQTRQAAAKQLFDKRNEDTMRQIVEAYQTRDIQAEYFELITGLGAFLTCGSSFVDLSKKGSSVPSSYSAPSYSSTPSFVTQTAYAQPSSVPQQYPPQPQYQQQPYQQQPYPPPQQPPPQQQQQMRPVPLPSIPQPLPSVPAQVKRCRALYPFTAQGPNELSLHPGDVININHNSHPDWWNGTCNGLTGDFPSNYVQMI